MARLMGFDYGQKRVGIAVTDPDKMIASGLTTVGPHEVFSFIKDYINRETVEGFVVGEPKTLRNEPSESAVFVKTFLNGLGNKFPDIPVFRTDERFTSKMAFQTMIDGGLKKKARQNKSTVDAVSAALILQSFMEQERFKNSQ